MTTPFSQTIETWYARNGRELPWRGTKDAYRIWVSEIILQQTRVAQGYDYYLRFVERFPDVRSLAEASEDEVMRLWQGLGYYSRARNMHKAARQVMERGGEFPRTYEEVRSLAGIGDYTAAAIVSFAYDQPYAVLDGNVFRVLSRTQGIDTPIDSTQGKKLFAALAQEFLDTQQPALYNQALMDFGALVCTPHVSGKEKSSTRSGKRMQVEPENASGCLSCPLNQQCVAFAEGRVDELPVKSHRTSVRTRYLIYIYAHDDTHFLLHRRGAGDIWQGLYEYPLIESPAPLSPQELMQQEPVATWLAQGAQLTLRRTGMKHQLTHQTLLADFYDLTFPNVTLSDSYSQIPTGEDSPSISENVLPHYLCVPLTEADRYAMPRLLLLAGYQLNG